MMRTKPWLLVLMMFILLGLWAGDLMLDKLDQQPLDLQPREQLQLAEQFIDAFYTFQAVEIREIPFDSKLDIAPLLYYQAWAEGGNYKVAKRTDCYKAIDELIYCRIKVTDDLGGNLGYIATDTFTLSIIDREITKVEFEGDDPFVFTRLLISIYLFQPEVFDGPCDKMFDGGKTPKACVQAVVAAAKEFNL